MKKYFSCSVHTQHFLKWSDSQAFSSKSIGALNWKLKYQHILLHWDWSRLSGKKVDTFFFPLISRSECELAVTEWLVKIHHQKKMLVLFFFFTGRSSYDILISTRSKREHVHGWIIPNNLKWRRFRKSTICAVFKIYCEIPFMFSLYTEFVM